jgi:hypothetical protein
MPRTRHARGKRPRPWKDDWIVLPQPTLDELIREMEKPLEEALGLTGALKLMGKSLADHCDGDRGVLTVSEAVFERLQTVQDAWLGIKLAGRGRGRSINSPRDKPRQMAHGSRT